MVKSKCPKCFWDNRLELEALIRANTARDIYDFKGEVPQMVMMGETSDISLFCEFGWWEWVYF